MLSVGPAAAAASAVRTGLKAISADNGTAFRIVRRLTKREPGFSVSSPEGRSARQAGTIPHWHASHHSPLIFRVTSR